MLSRFGASVVRSYSSSDIPAEEEDSLKAED